MHHGPRSDVLGGTVSEPESLPEHGVTVVFVELPNTKIELLHPYGDKSPIQVLLSTSVLRPNLCPFATITGSGPTLHDCACVHDTMPIPRNMHEVTGFFG